MKKVSFRVRNFDKEQFLTFNIDNDADLDEDVLDFLEEEEPKGIVPVIFDDEDENNDTFSYDITDKIHLTELANQEINAEMVLMVMHGIVTSLINMSEYRIPLSYLVMNRNYIYIDSDYRVEFICIPLQDMDEKVDVNGFLRGFIASLRFDSSENGDYVAKLLTYVNNTAIFNLRNLLDLVEELMDDYGVEIPIDENEIYADYQEVVEDEAVEAQDEAADESSATAEETEDNADGEAGAEEYKESDEEAGAEEYKESDEETDNEGYEESDEEAEAEEYDESDEEADDEEYDDSMERTSILTDAMKQELFSKEDSSEELINDGASEAAVGEAKELIDKIKQQVLSEKADDAENAEGEEEQKKEVTGTVIEDDFEKYLAEREQEAKLATKQEPGIKIKKNIKVSRASIVKQEEERIAEETAEIEEERRAREDAERAAAEEAEPPKPTGMTGLLRGNTVPKANPYLIRVNTNERIMITKQQFKIGKASMGVDYTVKGNGAVSRVHAIITCKEDSYYIRDNKSTNHTYVNGKIVEDGDNEMINQDSKIMLGDEEFIFKLK